MIARETLPSHPGQRLIGDVPDTGQSDDVRVAQVENTHETTEAALGEREDDSESIVMAEFVQEPDPPEESRSDVRRSLVRRSTLSLESRLSSKASTREVSPRSRPVKRPHILEPDESEKSSQGSSASSGRSHASRNSRGSRVSRTLQLVPEDVCCVDAR